MGYKSNHFPHLYQTHTLQEHDNLEGYFFVQLHLSNHQVIAACALMIFPSLSCIFSRNLITGFFPIAFLLFVWHCCSFHLYSGSSLAICIPIQLRCHSVSLYTGSCLDNVMLFLLLSCSPCLYTVFISLTLPCVSYCICIHHLGILGLS